MEQEYTEGLLCMSTHKDSLNGTRVSKELSKDRPPLFKEGEMCTLPYSDDGYDGTRGSPESTKDRPTSTIDNNTDLQQDKKDFNMDVKFKYFSYIQDLRQDPAHDVNNKMELFKTKDNRKILHARRKIFADDEVKENKNERISKELGKMNKMSRFPSLYWITKRTR